MSGLGKEHDTLSGMRVKGKVSNDSIRWFDAILPFQHLQRTRLGRMSNSVLSPPAAQDGVREQYTGTSDVGANLRDKSWQGRVSGVIPIRRKATRRWVASGCKLLYGAVVQLG